MKKWRLQYPVEIMSRLLNVSMQGYYAWLMRKPSKRDRDNKRMELLIMAIHKKSKETYGPLRIQAELKELGYSVSIHRIIRLRKKAGIYCKQKKKFKATTNSKHDLPVYENLLKQDFDVYKPNTVWVSDITYVRTEEGWLYLAGVEDLYNREIVGYAIDSRMTKELVINALNMAIFKRKPGKDLIHHSDRGSQYCSNDFRKLLNDHDIKGSMSAKGNCYDNAVIESFWGKLKTERLNHRKFRTRKEAEIEIRNYIELWYNRQRRHSKLGNVSPAEYLRNYYKRRLVA